MSTLPRQSRRTFLTGCAALAAQKGQISAAYSIGEQIAYVGSYSLRKSPDGSTGNGDGISIFRHNPTTGVLTKVVTVADLSNPSCLALNPNRTCLYATHEITHYNGAVSGSVSAFSIDRSNGSLTLLNTVSSRGSEPAFLSVDPLGRYVFTANYTGSNISAFRIFPDGKLSASTDSKQVRLPVGREHATNAPPGSFAISGHEQSHAHMIQSDPIGRYVLSTDLGADSILVWTFSSRTGEFNANPKRFALPSGDGPRHFCFHPNGRTLYSVQEESSTVATFDYNQAEGELNLRSIMAGLPKHFAGTTFASEIKVDKRGQFLYIANRLHDSIAIFALNSSSLPRLIGEEWTRGDYPNSFEFSPNGAFLHCCNEKADAITAFAVNESSGLLSFTGQYVAAGSPTMIVFL